MNGYNGRVVWGSTLAAGIDRPMGWADGEESAWALRLSLAQDVIDAALDMIAGQSPKLRDIATGVREPRSPTTLSPGPPPRSCSWNSAAASSGPARDATKPGTTGTASTRGATGTTSTPGVTGRKSASQQTERTGAGRLIARQPGVQRLARHPHLLGELRHRQTIADHRQHGLIPLLSHAQLPHLGVLLRV